VPVCPSASPWKVMKVSVARVSKCTWVRSWTCLRSHLWKCVLAALYYSYTCGAVGVVPLVVVVVAVEVENSSSRPFCHLAKIPYREPEILFLPCTHMPTYESIMCTLMHLNIVCRWLSMSVFQLSKALTRSNIAFLFSSYNKNKNKNWKHAVHFLL